MADPITKQAATPDPAPQNAPTASPAPANGTPAPVQTPVQPQTATPNPAIVLNAPKFLALAPEDQHSVLSHIDPNYAALAPADQQSVLAHLKATSRAAKLSDADVSEAAKTGAVDAVGNMGIIPGGQAGLGAAKSAAEGL